MAGMKPNISVATDGQPTWKDVGLPDLRSLPPGEPAPQMLAAEAHKNAAVDVLRSVLGVSPGGERAIRTPVEQVSIRDSSLPHVVEKRQDARERYARFIEPTLLRPTEVWAVSYDDGTLRNRYIKLFSGSRYDMLVMVRINPDGSVFWNMMHRDRKGMNALRLGRLVYSRP